MTPRRSFVHLLLAFAVLLCGLHIEPAHAEDGDAFHGLVEMTDAADLGDAPEGQAEQAGHHHCPVAPESTAPTERALLPVAAMHCARPITALRSLTRAPPIEPPAA
jgi:hypothetical protein